MALPTIGCKPDSLAAASAAMVQFLCTLQDSKLSSADRLEINSARKAFHVAPTVEESEILVLDAETREDLGLFGSDTNNGSLFDYCDQCRTEGGRKVLRRRMEAPWSSANRIQATQDAISFILKHREIFNPLPSNYVALNVERYITAAFPLLKQENSVEFVIAAYFFWVNDEHFYSKIIRGVELTSRLLNSLRRFCDLTKEVTPLGELASLVEEMVALLEEPKLVELTGKIDARWVWQKLRLDQTYRMHERLNIIKLLQLTYELDALVSLADVTGEHNLVMPCIGRGPVQIVATGLVHPALPKAVPNEVELNQERRVLFLTGPNMAGKTTYLRAITTALYMAHLGMGVPATRFHFVAVERLLTSISLRDDLHDGVSYFRAEALRVKAVAEAIAAGFRTVAIMDEPFKGTNVKDAFDASLEILKRFAGSTNCLFVVSSHLIELGEQLNKTANIDYRYFEADESKERLSFDFVLHNGVSSQRLGMRVLREEGVFELLDSNQPRNPT